MQNNNQDQLIQEIIQAMDDMKAEKVSVLDLQELDNAVCSYFVICTGNSNTQVNSIAESIERQIRKSLRERPYHVEGKQNGQWVLMDYVTVVVHIFQEEYREFYNIESLWGDAVRTDITLKQN